MTTLVLLLVFAATFGVVLTGYAFLDRERLEAARAARARLAPLRPGAQDTEAVRLLRRVEALSGFALLDRLLHGRAFTARMGRALARAGVSRTVGELALAVAVASAGGLVLGTFVGGALVGFVGMLAGGCLPWAALLVLERRRLVAFEAQLPETLDTLVNSLRAGYSFPAALEFAASETPAPLGPELARARDEQRLGVEVRVALNALAERVPTMDMRMFVTCVLIQRDTGGNLAELLADLSGMVRERAAFRGKVQALTAEPRMSALVLALLPLAFFLILLVINPGYVQPMLATPGGRLVLGLAAAATAVGYVVMRRLGDVEM